MPSRATRKGGRPESSWPLSLIRAERDGARPMMLRSVVLLPAPFRPRRQMTLACSEARYPRRWWSGSSAIRLSPPRIRACGFPALGSSRRLPNAGQGNLARVSNPGRRQGEAFQQRVESLPCQSALTPPAQYAIPAAPYRVVKAIQAWPVARQPVVGVVPSQHTAEPAMLRLNRRVHAAPQLRLHVLHLPTDSPAFGPPLDHKAPVSAPSAVVDESEKRKRTRSPCVARSSVLGHEFPELDEARLVPVECQLELPQPLPERHQHLPCVRLALKAHHEVVRVAHETDSPVPRLPPPLLDPQVERVMQKDVRQERTDPRPLWRPLYRLPPLQAFHHAGSQPSPYQLQHATVGHP